MVSMKKLLFLLLAFAGLNAAAQQTKIIQDANARQRTIAGAFTQISVATGIQLYLTQGNETSLAISVSNEKYNKIFKTEVVNGVLKIYMDIKEIGWLKDKNRLLKAYLSIKTLEKLTASSGAEVFTADTLNVNGFIMKFSSGAQFNGVIKATDLQIDQSSGSEINISGAAANLKIRVSSGASFSGYYLITQNCTAKASSGADANITVTNTLDAHASSGGTIQYKGNGSVKTLRANSGGSVRKV